MKLSEYIKEFGDKQVDVDKLSELIVEYKVFVPKVGDTYWYIDSFGNVLNHAYSDRIDHNQLIRITQVYRTEAEAEFARDKAIFLEFMRKEFLRNSDVVDWKDDKQYKYEIYYSHAHKLIAFSTASSFQRKGLYTTDYQWLRDFMGEHKDDIKKYYFEIKGEVR